eukprot:gene16893-22920_t
MRTPPHYHHTCDHVLCLYLDCGQDRPSRDTLTREMGDGELVLQDPRPMAGFPFWEKTKYIYTTPGLAVLHPSRVWHETNPFVGTGHRSLLAFRIKTQAPDGSEPVLLYDNQTSSLTWEDSRPVAPVQPRQYEDATVVSVDQP